MILTSITCTSNYYLLIQCLSQRFRTVNVPYYSASWSLLEKRVKSIERLTFLNHVIAVGVIPTEFNYLPKVPQGITLSASELVSWNRHIHNSELDMLSQLILTMKRQTATLDKEATRALLEFNDQLNDYKISTSNVEKSKTILSEKVGKERVIYKLKLCDQLSKLTDNFNTIKTNMHFLKNAGIVASNKPSSTAPRSSSPTWRKKIAPLKKNPLSNRGNYLSSILTPKENRVPKSATASSQAPPSLPATQVENSVSQTGSTDTQTTLLLKVVERLVRQQEELNFLREYPSLPRDRVRSRSPFQGTFKPPGQQTNSGRNNPRGRQNSRFRRDQSHRRDQSRRPYQRRDQSKQRHNQY